MRYYLLGAAALAVIATPAAARDNSAYFGLEVGALFPKDTEIEVDGDDLFDIEHKTGVDGDMIAGYDFGMFRLEGELGYKRSEHDQFTDGSDEIDADGRSSVYSGMINGMVDLGRDGDWNFYAGAGAGYAQVTHVIEEGEDGPANFRIRDRGLAWQLIAGVRKTVSQYFDVGLKYRYFSANVPDSFDDEDLDADYRSHSVLVSLIHNFAPPPPPPAPVIVPPPPPPAPPPPATQTCPDGSVVLATDTCPMPPPPPPPPPPEPERG